MSTYRLHLCFFNLLFAFLVDHSVTCAQPTGDPVLVLQAYLRATYARDFTEAYRHISSADQRVRDLNVYLKQQGSFGGFALEVGKKLSEAIEIRPIRQEQTGDRLVITIQYKVPDPSALAPLLLNWDTRRLNSLTAPERGKILRVIENQKRDSTFAWSEGEQKFELVREPQQWRVHFDWSAGVKIPLRVDLTRASDLDISLSKHQIVTQPGELFEIVLKVKNRAQQPAFVRVGHLIEPHSVAEYLEFVQCGFLLPIALAPAEEREFSGTYLLRGNRPDAVREIDLTYDFRVLSESLQ